MKKVLFFCLLVSLFSTSLFAQTGEKQTGDFKHLVGVSPFTLWHGLRLKYEAVLTPKMTLGGTLTGYYGGSFPGGQLAPLARFYFKGNAPEGFYAQAKIVGGYHSFTGKEISGEESKKGFMAYGGGIAAGYQLLWGKSDKWSLDFNLGAKFVLNNNEGGLASGASWVLLGPGSIVDGMVSIGYRF
jgi:hypothetical protein